MLGRHDIRCSGFVLKQCYGWVYYNHHVCLSILSKWACTGVIIWHTAVGIFVIIIVIMYIYHALINTLSAHMIHINLNTIFYTHMEHSPTKTIYIKYYMDKHTHRHARTHTRTHTHTHDCSRNWVLILVGFLA